MLNHSDIVTLLCECESVMNVFICSGGDIQVGAHLPRSKFNAIQRGSIGHRNEFCSRFPELMVPNAWRDWEQRGAGTSTPAP